MEPRQRESRSMSARSVRSAVVMFAATLPSMPPAPYRMRTSMFPSATYRVFSSRSVRALTRLTARQLQHWDEPGFLKPSIATRTGRGTLRLYSFQDLVALKVAAELRGTLPLQTLRRLVAYFQKLDD